MKILSKNSAKLANNTLAIVALLALSGCQTVGRWADNVGSYMPVIGDRCQHWQCITTLGQEKSDAINAEITKTEEEKAKAEEEKEKHKEIGEPLPSDALDNKPLLTIPSQ